MTCVTALHEKKSKGSANVVLMFDVLECFVCCLTCQ